jgi:hypothetical protein
MTSAKMVGMYNNPTISIFWDQYFVESLRYNIFHQLLIDILETTWYFSKT